MKYVSPAYEQQLRELAELLVTPERAQPVGQVALAEVIQLDDYRQMELPLDVA